MLNGLLDECLIALYVLYGARPEQEQRGNSPAKSRSRADEKFVVLTVCSSDQHQGREAYGNVTLPWMDQEPY